ncbi:MAG: glutamate mutase L, partial [Planctomycetota bacterium]|nr:glutamate mutase L [Planctomycetota bacterium]
LGMSYSISNVLKETGIENIVRWIPHPVDVADVKDRLRNKMIRPTTIPQTLEDLLVEHAVAREALRLAFEHHKMLAVGLKGVHIERTIADAFTQKTSGESLIDMMRLDILVGSGGILSHAPMRHQAALMMLDSFQPEGVSFLAVDSIFMMPQLGVLSQVHPEAAAQVFKRDCLVELGSVVAPKGLSKEGAKVAKITLHIEGKTETYDLKFGDLVLVPLPVGKTAKALIEPSRNFDVGGGRGAAVERILKGGTVGLILDGRGRPLLLPESGSERITMLRRWLSALTIPFC